MTHEGWKNAATWSIALYIDNEREQLTAVLELFRKTPMNKIEEAFKNYVDCRLSTIQSGARWAFYTWPLSDIDWAALMVHYAMKVQEGVR